MKIKRVENYFQSFKLENNNYFFNHILIYFHINPKYKPLFLTTFSRADICQYKMCSNPMLAIYRWQKYRLFI